MSSRANCICRKAIITLVTIPYERNQKESYSVPQAYHEFCGNSCVQEENNLERLLRSKSLESLKPLDSSKKRCNAGLVSASRLTICHAGKILKHIVREVLIKKM